MYFLTVIETDRNFNEYSSSTVVGYFKTYEEVVEILHSNYCNINGACYTYVVVEQIYSGLYPSSEKTIFFKYDSEKNGYFEIEKPKVFDHLDNFALG